MKAIVIVAPSFEENRGGAIALHVLAHELVTRNLNVVLYPMSPSPDGTFKRFNEAIPIAEPHSDFSNAIGIYPEVIDRNPLRFKTVIRWLLHRPKFINPEANFDDDEFFFRYNCVHYAKNESDYLDLPLLSVSWLRDDIFFNQKKSRPIDKCAYLNKVSAYHPKIPNLPDETLVLDHLNAAQKSAVLNISQYVHVYDPHTFLIQQAMLCGCIPLIEPCQSINTHDYYQNHRINFGYAYGQDQLQFARDTLAEGIRQIYEIEDENIRSVNQFVDFIERL